MIRGFFILGIALFGYTFKTTAQSDGPFTIYLVRHSEKDQSSVHQSDLPLSQCGEQRSETLSIFFSDVRLEAVYSTDFTRTISTAKPTAISKGLEIQKYEPSDLESFAQTLLDRKQDALVVGHSNTTGYLAGVLIGEEVEHISLDIYDRIYQVVVAENSSRLHLLHSSFKCHE